MQGNGISTLHACCFECYCSRLALVAEHRIVIKTNPMAEPCEREPLFANIGNNISAVWVLAVMPMI